MLAHSILRRAAKLFSERCVVFEHNTCKTYREMYKRVLRLSNSLLSLGIGKGNVIGVADWNTAKFFELHYAASLIGALIYPVNIRLPPDQIAYTIKVADVDYLFVSDDFKAIANFVPENRVISLDFPSKVNYNDLIDDGDAKEPEVEVLPNDYYSILFTSGTTGLPKATRYTHEKLLQGALSIAYQLGLYKTPARLSSEDVIFPFIPFYHIHAWGIAFIAPYLGAKLVLGGKFDPMKAIELIEKEKVTWINAVPTMVTMLLQSGMVEKLNGVKALVGGSPLTADLAKKMVDSGMSFTTIYGATDMLAASISIVSSEAEKGDVIDYIRQTTHPVPFAEMKVIGMDGKVAKDGEMGELYFKASWLSGEYYKDEEKTREAYQDGWFKTGDVAIMLPDGGIRILDRVKDAVKSGGEWIPTSILESVISEVDGVEMVAVLGKRDEKWGERPVAIIKGNVDAEKVKEHLAKVVEGGRISKWWMPDEVRFVDDLPLTSTGKIDKLSLRKLLE